MCIVTIKYWRWKKGFDEELRLDRERKEAARKRLIEQQDRDINLDSEE